MLNDSGKLKALNILDFNSIYNVPLRHANIKKDSHGISAPLFNHAGGNTIVMHWQFDDPRIAGYGMKKAIGVEGTYAWYKNPVYYVDYPSFKLEEIEFTLSPIENHFTDTTIRKYYPLISKTTDDDWITESYPTDKDINDGLSFSSELIIYSEVPKTVVIGNAFAKYNNLIQEFSTTPDVKIYKGIEPFNTFDKYVRADDTLEPGTATLVDKILTVLDRFSEAMDYWCLAYNDEIIIAGNGVSVVKFMFSKNRQAYEHYDETLFVISTDLELDLDLSAAINMLYNKEASLELELELSAETAISKMYRSYAIQELELGLYASVRKIDIIRVSATPQLELDLQASVSKSTTEPTVTYIDWTAGGGDSIYYEFQVTNNDSNYAEIFADENATPTSSYGWVAPNTSVSVIILSSDGSSITCYARAKAENKFLSTIDSATGSII